MINAQEWLDKHYPKGQRKKVIELNLSGWDVSSWEGKIGWERLNDCLDLREFVNLKKLDCSDNQLTSLVLTGLNKLEWIKCDDNYLTDFNYSSLNPNKLIYLNIGDNNLPEQNLSVFIPFNNLELLWIGNSKKEKIQENIYNFFVGNLEALKDLTRLEYLNISNTDIDSGLECLPSSLKEIYCEAYQEDYRVARLQNDLAPHKAKGEYGECYDFQKWKTGIPGIKVWNVIHPNFAKDCWVSKQTNQHVWEKQGFTPQDARRWIEIGFEPGDCHLVQEWINHGFYVQQTQLWTQAGFQRNRYEEAQEWISLNLTPQDAQFWIDKGLSSYDYDLAAYAAANDCFSVDIEELRKEFEEWITIAQNYLEFYYPLAKRSEIKEINVSRSSKNDKLEGSLTIADFPQLERIYCDWNMLTSLTINNCPQLIYLDCSNNRLASLDFLNNQQQLIELRIHYNKFSQDLSFLSQFINLESLWINSNSFYDSLESLKNYEKLKWLDISQTCIDSGLEHLPEGLEYFRCDETKLKEELKPYNGSIKAWKIDQEKQALESDLSLTEHRIAVLQSLINEQKQKIINAYKAFSPEKKLLQQLITAHLEYCKAGKQRNKQIIKLRQQRDAIRNELEAKLGEEFAVDIEYMLSDCDSLIGWMTELDEQLTKRQNLLEDQKQLLQITNGNEAKIVELEAKIKEYKKTNHNQSQALEKQLANFEGQLVMLAKRPQQINYNTDISGWTNNDSKFGAIGDNNRGLVINEATSQFQAHIHSQQRSK